MKRFLGVLLAAAIMGTTPAVAQGAPPEGVTGMALDARAEISWQPVAGATAYNVYRGTSAAAVNTPVSLTGVPPPPMSAPASFIDTTAANGTTYFYGVRAVVGGVESGNSRLVQVTPQARLCSGSNVVTQENCFPGVFSWKVPSDSTGIDGFATKQSINKGESIDFKIKAATPTVSIEIFRNGFYGGSGARLYTQMDNVPVASQPACATNASTGLYDCSNWSVTQTITTTADWPSGVYLARITRPDTFKASHILFVVRDDARQSDVLFGLPFTTYEAYNSYGGKSIYEHNSTGADTVAGDPRAVKVSFDRPFQNQFEGATHDWYTRTDYVTVKWMESAGYDVSYDAVGDFETGGARIRDHRAYISGAHDEYQSAAMRGALESARDAGVDLLFTGANELFWKVRFEASPSSGVQNRVLVCYKSSQSGGPDPSGIPTGTWRDPVGANNPENALSGVQFIGQKPFGYFPLRVSAAQGQDRVWRNTGLDTQTAGSFTNVGNSLVGWEWDARVPNGAEPPGVVTLAASPVDGDILQDAGGIYAPGTAVAHMVKKQWPSGSLVVATGTNQWNLGLAINAEGVGEPDRRIQQAMTNILLDMGATPETPASDIVLDDTTSPPTVTQKTPSAGATGVEPGTTVRATFSRAMDPATINTSSFTLKRPDGTTVPASVTYDSLSFTATLTPSMPLALSTSYTAQLASTIKSANDVAIGAAQGWNFATRAPDSTPPVVSVTAPQSGATVGGTVNLTANATDNSAVAGVQFRVDSTNVGSQDTTAPYSISWDARTFSAGSHQIRAVATDTSGNSTTSAAIPVTVDNTGLVAAYGFEEASGTTATDVSGQANNGTINGPTRTSGGRFGSALAFDGSNDEVTVPDSASLDLTTAMTLEAWVRPSGGTDWQTALMKETSNGLAYGLYANSDTNRPSAHVNTTREFDTRGAAALPAGTWTHLAATYDGANLRLYINGALANSIAVTGSMATSANPLRMGGNAIWGEHYGGLIDEVRVYRRTLNAAEITTDMNTAVAGGAPPPGPDTIGQFTAPIEWPLVPVHIASLSDGKVAVWDGFDAAVNSERVWDPATGNFDPVPTGRNLFCAGHVTLPDGRLFVAGGHIAAYEGTKDTNIFNPSTRTWFRGADMLRARWYPTVTTLPDGRILTLSGDNVTLHDTSQPVPMQNGSETLPEIYNVTTNSWSSLTAAQRRMPLYPFMFVLPDGRVFDAGPDTTTRTLNTTTGQWTTVGTSPIDGHSAVMYRPGKILKSGTWGDPDFPNRVVSNRAATIDMTVPNPAWQEAAPMHFPRSYHTLTSLPDGTVMASGGGTSSDGVTQSSGVLATEIWNPDTNTWKETAAAQRPRLYHSSALLLADGRVLLAGGGAFGTAVNQSNAEIFSPPYLFKGARPTITSAPGLLAHNQTFSVSTPDAANIQSVALMRMGSVTHNFDMDQRYIPLTFRAGGTAGTLSVDAPANPNVAPPGRYMLFVLNDKGVPSVASLLTVSSASADTSAPSQPGGPTATVSGDNVSLSWTPSTDDRGVTEYRIHRSTTSGFTPSAANRVATVSSGTTYTDSGVAPGSYYYVVVAADAAGNTSTPSREEPAVVGADTTAPTVSVTAPAAGATLSGTVSVTANASDNRSVTSVQFRLDGADLGAADTTSPYSTSWNTTTATNGTHTLTAIAKDAAGNSTTATNVTVTVNNVTNANGLVAAYGFEEASGATTVDDSGTGNTGTISGPTRTATGKFGSALSFDGVNDWVSIPDADSLDLTTNMTLEAWVKPTALNAWQAVLIKEQLSGLTYGLYSNTDTNRPSAHAFTTREFDTRGTSALPVNGWTHLAATYDGATLRIFVNGVQASSLALSGGMLTSTGALRIGGDSLPSEWFAGLIDEVRVYKRTLTAAEIQQDMNTAVKPVPTDTQAPGAPGGLTATGGLGQAQLAWTAATDNVGVARYNVYRSTTAGFTPGAGNLVAQVTGTSWTDAGRPAGTYYYRVTAEDAAGNVGPASGQASAVVTADTTAPTVTISSPAGGSTVSGTIDVNATASDNVGVAGVQFKLDGANLGAEDTASPYTQPWSTNGVANGSHALTAVARDASGNTKTSTTVTVTVNNTATTGLVGAYGFEETSGTTAVDSSGSGNPGTINGPVSTTAGKFGRALSFDGVNDLVTVADSNALDLTTGMTLEAWVRPTSVSGWDTALLKEQTNGLVYSIYANTDANRPSGHVFTNAEFDTRGTAQLAANTWSHLAATYDGTTLKLYVNGTLASSKAVTGSLFTSTGALRIGGNNVWPEWFTGQIDEVRVYKRALTATEVTADMNRAVLP